MNFNVSKVKFIALVTNVSFANSDQRRQSHIQFTVQRVHQLLYRAHQLSESQYIKSKFNSPPSDVENIASQSKEFFKLTIIPWCVNIRRFFDT